MRRHLLAALALAVAAAIPCAQTSADDIWNWSGTDASNNRTPPNGFPEGMFPSQVDDGMRAVMGAIKRAWDNSVGGGNAVVANTTALRAACTSAASCPASDPVFPAGVDRLTDGAAGAPKLKYLPDTGSACSADDGGACVAAANGGYWHAQLKHYVDIRQWGGTGNGTTNDATADQAAMTWASAHRAVLEIPANWLSYIGSTTLTDNALPLIIHGNNPPSTNDGNSSVCLSGFTNVAAGVSASASMMTLSGEGSKIDHVCFQAGVSSSRASAGTALTLSHGASASAGYQSAQWNVVYYAYNGIDVGGSGGSFAVQSPDVEHNWIASPVNAGMRFGPASTGAKTINVTALDNRVTCDAGAPAPDGFLLNDAAIDHWNGNDATQCGTATDIEAGASQHVLGFFSGVIGDTSTTYELHINSTASTGLVNDMTFTNCWLSGNQAGETGTVKIENTGGGTERVFGITFTACQLHTIADVPIFDLENDVALIVVQGSWLTNTSGTNNIGTAWKDNSSGHGNRFIGNHLYPQNGSLKQGVVITSAVTGYVTVRDNDFATTLNPIVWTQPATTPLLSMDISDNLPMKSQFVPIASATNVAAANANSLGAMWNVTGTTTIQTFSPGAFWDNEDTRLVLENGASLSAAANNGSTPGAFCNNVTSPNVNTRVDLHYDMGSECWIVAPMPHS